MLNSDRYRHKDGQQMHKTLVFFVRNLVPIALSQCRKAIAEATITIQRLKFNIIKFALGLLHDLTVTDGFPTAPIPTETKSTQTKSDPPQSWLHVPLRLNTTILLVTLPVVPTQHERCDLRGAKSARFCKEKC